MFNDYEKALNESYAVWVKTGNNMRKFLMFLTLWLGLAAIFGLLNGFLFGDSHLKYTEGSRVIK